MRRLGAQHCPNSRTQIIKLKRKVYEVQKAERSKGDINLEKMLNRRLLEAYKDEEKYWSHKARIKRLMYVD